jgi:hypothetical protein
VHGLEKKQRVDLDKVVDEEENNSCLRMFGSRVTKGWYIWGVRESMRIAKATGAHVKQGTCA